MGFKDEIAAQKERLFLWVPVAFGLGIVVYFSLWFEPAFLASFILLGLFAPMCFWTHRHHHDTVPWFCAYLFSAALLLMTLGLLSAQVGTTIYGTPILEKETGAKIIEGRIESVEVLGGKKGSRVVLRDVSIEDIPEDQTPKKVRMSFRKNEGLKAGARIQTLGSLSPPSGAVAPGAYDFRRHFFFEGIGGVGFSFKAATILENGVSQDPDFFEGLREHINTVIRNHAGGVVQGIVAAMITGERAEISQSDDDAMRASGLYHLLSISGTHVAMVAGVLFFFCRFFMALIPWVTLRWPIKKIAAVLALCGATFYVFLAGAEVPAQRALIMTGLVLFAVIIDRSALSLRLIAFSALVVLIVAPHALTGVSFQMSFAAVAGLICFFDYVRPQWRAWSARAGFLRKSLLYLAGICITSAIAGTVTGVFSLYHFQNFSIYGVPSNMIAVPLTGFVIMPAAIVSVLMIPFGLESFPLQVMEWGTLWLLATAHWFSTLQGAVLHVHQWPQATLGFMAAGLVLFLLWQGWRGKAIGLCVMVFGLMIGCFAPMPDVFLSGSGKLSGVYKDHALYVSSGRREKFISENWIRLLGLEGQKPKSFRDETSGILCDSDACRMEMKGKKVSFVRTQRGLHEDCIWADMVIAEFPFGHQDCGAQTTLSLFDLKDSGGMSVRIKDGAFILRPVYGKEQRPWTPKRKLSFEKRPAINP